jgi:nucleoside-diphosphate-sugar epimerase
LEALVLGGTRFVGLHLVKHLTKSGHRVTVLNRGLTESILPDTVARLKADRLNPDSIRSALSQKHFDAVYDISGYKPQEVRTVLKALENRVRHYIFCSSVAVYSDNNSIPIIENERLRRGPSGDYGRNKMLCENVLRKWSNSSGIPSTIIRPPYVYGPDDHITRRLFSIFERLYQKRPVIVPGSGKTLNHSVHVDDLASAFSAVSWETKSFNQTYNVAGPESVTLETYIELVASVMNTTADIVKINSSDYKKILRKIPEIKPTDICDLSWNQSYEYSTCKIQHDLGWYPKYGMIEGLQNTYEWWLENGLNKITSKFHSDELLLTYLLSS